MSQPVGTPWIETSTGPPGDMPPNVMSPEAMAPGAMLPEGPASTEDDTFNKLLEAFKAEYQKEATFIEKSMNEVFEWLNTALEPDHGIRAAHVTCRVKTIDSAIKSLRRRRKSRQERAKLKEQLEKLGADWEEYWMKQERPDRVKDFGEFDDCNSLFRAIHDIGAVRVLLYSPGDVKRVVDAIRKAEIKGILKINRIVRRGLGIAPDMHQLDSHIKVLQGSLSKNWTPDGDDTRSAIMAGYRATHAIVVFGDRKEYPVVEIQITTLVMNAWSQIEHDIVYKPDNGEPSTAELGILKTFNDVVAVGESALKQLEDVQREANETPATTIYDIGKWIISHTEDSASGNRDVGKFKNMEHLHVLFEVLKCRHAATSSKIKRLVEGLESEAGHEQYKQHELPVHLMWRLPMVEDGGTNPFYKKSPSQPLVDPDRYEREMAYRPALEIVRVLNLASYLGVKPRFIRIMDISLQHLARGQKPTMANFLGLLHPHRGKMHPSVKPKVISFCRAFLDTNKFEAAATEYLKTKDHDGPFIYELRKLLLPFKLVERGFTAHLEPEKSPPMFTGRTASIEPSSLYVQREFCRWLHDPKSTHWIPDIIACASQLDNGTFSQLQPPRHPMMPTNIPRRVDARSDDEAGRKTDKPETSGPSTGTSLQVTFHRQNRTIIWEWSSSEPLPFELHDDPAGKGKHLHMDKTAQRPLDHAGFFVSTTSEAGEPAWDYCLGPDISDWEIRDALWDPCKVDWREDIDDELHDMASYLNHGGSFSERTRPAVNEERAKEAQPLSTQPATYYTFVIKGFEYVLTSTSDEFVLSLGPN